MERERSFKLMRVNLENTSIIADIMLKGSAYSAESLAMVENAFLSRWKKEMNRLYCPLSKSGLNPELR